MGFRMKDFNIFGFHWKICAYFWRAGGKGGGGGQEKPIYKRGIAPKGVLDSLQI